MNPKVEHHGSGLEARLRFETLLADLSSRFVNLEPALVDREIEEAQRRVCECLGLDIAVLWQLSPDEPGVLRMTHYHRVADDPPIPEDFDARESFPWALGKVFAGEVVTLPEVASRRGFDLVEELLQAGKVPVSPPETETNGDAR